MRGFDNSSSVLQAQAVAFRYPQDGRGLQPFTLEIRAGEGVLVSGPSGCGKSTLARCLTGLIPHLYRGEMRGAVWLAGQRTDQTPLWKLAEHAGIVFQNPASQMIAPSVEDEILFGLENLGISRDEMRKRLEQALERFELASFRQRAPQTLSGGEQQKLALAAITARQPEVLVLDEPLSMLDTRASFDLIAQIERYTRSGKTAVIFEHRQEYLHSLHGLRVVNLNHASASPAPVEPVSWHREPCPEFHLQVDGLDVELGDRPVIENMNFSLQGGQIVALVGRNGVGKTTLLRSLAGLQRFAGNIRIYTGGGSQPPDLGIVFQNPDLQLFNPSVREEILYRLPFPDMALYRWLVKMLGLERYQGAPPLLLSEGEKRRVALATVLMRHPNHGILLDEPSLGQDGEHKAILIQLLRALAAEGRLVVMATHDLELALQADHLLLMGPNGIAAQGQPSELMHNSGVWDRLGFILPEWMISRC
jgi:energy-coupling factor transport system ATP-binding protein